jgi:lysine-N-methylase
VDPTLGQPASTAPTYVQAFHCLAAKCADNCCHGWGVFVDKAIYQKYRATPSLRRLAATHIEINPSCREPLKFGRIKFGPDGRCPFLLPEGLCRIHKEYGGEFLGEICSRYPRAYSNFCGQPQLSLFLSCGEAARHVLLSPALLPSCNPAERYRDFRCVDGGRRQKDELLSPGRLLQQLALQLLQDRSYLLWKRLFLLGLACARIQRLLDAGQDSAAAEVLKQYADIIVSGSLRSELQQIPLRLDRQLDIVLQLIRTRSALEPPGTEFAASVADLLQAVGRSPQNDIPASAELYAQAQVGGYRAFADAHPAFLENYLVNYVYRTRFPFADTIDHVEPGIEPASSFALMVVHYVMLRGLLVGAAARDRDSFSPDRAVKVATTFAKAVEHNPTFLEEMKTIIRSDGPLSADNLAALLKE